jgi:hypothetical protein
MQTCPDRPLGEAVRRRSFNDGAGQALQRRGLQLAARPPPGSHDAFALEALTRCWPCNSNSVCLGPCHLPRPEARSTDFALSAGILAAGPVQPVYSSKNSFHEEARWPCSLRGVRALFVGIQKLEVTSGELPLFAQAPGHAGLHQRSGRDPLKNVLVPREQLAQLRPNVGLRELWRHRQESTTRRARRPPAGPAGRRGQPEGRP